MNVSIFFPFHLLSKKLLNSTFLPLDMAPPNVAQVFHLLLLADISFKPHLQPKKNEVLPFYCRLYTYAAYII